MNNLFTKLDVWAYNLYVRVNCKQQRLEVYFMNFFEQVGRNILSILDEQNMTQVFLAKQIGVSRQVMQKITKGKKAINALEISEIANALQVSIDRMTHKFEVSNDVDSLVLFMGKISNIDVKEKFDFLNTIIDEIVHLEDDLNEQSLQ